MSGIIRTYQKCPVCGGKYKSSDGGQPITCCGTQPTKYSIKIAGHEFYYDGEGKGLLLWQDAQIALGEMRSERKRKGLSPEKYKKNSKTKFSVFWEKFLAKYDKKPSTHDKISAVGKHHLTYFSDFQMREIKAFHIDEWWDSILAKNLSCHYSNDIREWLFRFFKEALKIEIIDKIPAFPDPLSMPEPEVEDWLTEQEQLAVLEALPVHDRPIFDFLFLTGVRVNEATGLQRSDIDWQKGIITIKHTRKRDGSVGQVKNKKRRVIPIFRDVKRCFGKPNGVIQISQYQFTNKWGRPYSDDYLRDLFRRKCLKSIQRTVKLKNATRHSFGMGLLRKGWDIWQVSKIMNHSNIKVTEHYAQMIADDSRGAYGRGNENSDIHRRRDGSVGHHP